jgi:Fe-S cluster assembly protein SufD
MLSEHSEIACEPTLLIDEYNVEASHGAAIGKMDDLQLFYLLSRGLSETEAKALILSGYINPFINLIENDKLKKTVLTKINRTLRRA